MIDQEQRTLPFVGILTLLARSLIWILISLMLLAGILIPLALLAGVLIALTLLAGVLSATLLSGVLSTLMLLAGILIGLLRIIRIVHSNVSLQIVPTSHTVPPFPWKVVRKELAGKTGSFYQPARTLSSDVKNRAR
jgi:hypothetical protein